jgi:hypothetical protein
LPVLFQDGSQCLGMLSVSNKAQIANRVPASKINFFPNFLPFAWGTYTLYHFKADNMEHANNEIFYLDPFTKIAVFCSLYSTEHCLQIHPS